MPIYDITNNNDDWFEDSSTGIDYTSTTLKACYNNTFSPSLICTAYGDIDTTTIPLTDVISGDTLSFYIDSYTATKRVTKIFDVWMLKADDSAYILIGSYTYSATGWYSIVLTPSQYAEVDKGGYSRIRISVADPGALKYRDMRIRAKEYATNGDWDMKMDITHAPPVTLPPTRTLLGVGI